MPPKRKAAPKATEAVENGAEKPEPTKAKRGKASKPVEDAEDAVIKTTRSTRAKAAQEKVVIEEEPEKKGTKSKPAKEAKDDKKETKVKKEKASTTKAKGDTKAAKAKTTKKKNDESEDEEKPTTSTKTTAPKKKKPTTEETAPANIPNISDESEDEQFTISTKTIASKKKKATTEERAPPVNANIPNISDESEDEQTTTSTKTTAPKKKKPTTEETAPANIPNISDESEDEQFTISTKTIASKKKKATTEETAPPVNTNIPNISDESEDEQTTTSTKTTAPKKKKPTTKRKAPAKPKKTRNEKSASTEEAEPLQNQIETDYSNMDFTCEAQNAEGNLPNLKISSWNVDGLRAWFKKNGSEYIAMELPDILCLQEIKCSDDKIPDELDNFMDYKTFWLSGDIDGYSGVALFTKIVPISVEYGIKDKDFDNEGRCITAEYEKFYLVNVYVPNAGRRLTTLDKKLAWNKLFKEYIADLDERKPVIVCGDMNVAHNEIDLSNPKTNKKTAGFTQEERDDMTDFLYGRYVDTFRHFYPEKQQAYTFWTYLHKSRSKNVGWRLDYFIVSTRLLDNICDHMIRDKVYGSDHCPIVLYLNI